MVETRVVDVVCGEQPGERGHERPCSECASRKRSNGGDGLGGPAIVDALGEVEGAVGLDAVSDSEDAGHCKPFGEQTVARWEE